MKRNVLKVGALVGVASIAVLAAGPALAASTVSQATAQSLELSIAGNKLVSQEVSATNDGSGEVKNDASTLPTIASVVPGTSLLGVGVAPQEAGANVKNGNGTSYACAGIAGTGGGIVKVGDSSCNLDGKPLTIDLANLKLGETLLGNDSALGQALNGLPLIGQLLTTLGVGLDQLVTQLSNAVSGTPLGEITIGGSLSAIEASCTADPNGAKGDAHIVDSTGGSNETPIGLTLPGGVNLPLVGLPANPPPNTHVLVDLDKVTQTVLVDALGTELDTLASGALASVIGPVADALKPLLQQIQDQVVKQLVAGLQPLLQALQDNILDIVLNEQTKSADGKSIDVTALRLEVLPAAAQFTGSSLISGKIGHVTCGPNARVAATPAPSPSPTAPGTPDIPKHVDSGLAGNSSNTNVILAATTALLAMAGAAGLLAYRRFWMPRA